MVVRRSRKKRSRSPCRYGRKKSMKKGCKKRPGPRRSRIKKSRAKKNKPRLRSRVKRSRVRRSRLKRSRARRSRIKRSRVKRSRVRRSRVKRSRKKRSRLKRSRGRRSRVKRSRVRRSRKNRSRKKRSRVKRSRVRRSRKNRSRVKRSRVRRSRKKRSRVKRSRVRRSRKNRSRVKRSYKKKYKYNVQTTTPPRRKRSPGPKTTPSAPSTTRRQIEQTDDSKNIIEQERANFFIIILKHLEILSEVPENKFNTYIQQTRIYTQEINEFINNNYNEDYITLLFGMNKTELVDHGEFKNIINYFTRDKQIITLYQICDIMNNLKDITCASECYQQSNHDTYDRAQLRKIFINIIEKNPELLRSAELGEVNEITNKLLNNEYCDKDWIDDLHINSVDYSRRVREAAASPSGDEIEDGSILVRGSLDWTQT